MRLALVSLIALAAAASAAAQPTTAPADQPAAAPATPAAPAAAPAAPAAPAPPPIDVPPPPPPPPVTPPPAPTDPTAIALLSTLQNVCMPAANGGDLAKLAKANGYRKSGDDWSMRQRDFSLTIEAPGSNPNQCHVDVIHPVDPEAPGRPIVVALHDWATAIHGWSLYRNDKSVQNDALVTTRSWEHDANGKAESLVFTTRRHPDGAPMQRSADTSQMIYAVQASS